MKHVRDVYPDAAAALEKYAWWLETAGVTRGLIGPREASRIWDRHIANCAALEELIPHGSTVCDVGSGAGLPGIVLAIVRPDLEVTLVEPLQRRCEFLQEVAADLNLPMTVFRGRAQDLSGELFDVVTARAVAPLAKLLDWTKPLVKPNGQILAMKGQSAQGEIAQAGTALAKAHASIVLCGQSFVEPATTVVRVQFS